MPRKTSENDFFGKKHETSERRPARVIFAFVIQRPSFARISQQSKVIVSIFAKFESLRKWARRSRATLANSILADGIKRNLELPSSQRKQIFGPIFLILARHIQHERNQSIP